MDASLLALAKSVYLQNHTQKKNTYLYACGRFRRFLRKKKVTVDNTANCQISLHRFKTYVRVLRTVPCPCLDYRDAQGLRQGFPIHGISNLTKSGCHTMQPQKLVVIDVSMDKPIAILHRGEGHPLKHPSEVIFPYLWYSLAFYSFEFVALSMTFIGGEKSLARTILTQKT